MEQYEDHLSLQIAAPDGEVKEEREPSPEIESIHIRQDSEYNEESGSVQPGRKRAESTTSVSSESWQTNDETVAKLRRAQSLLDSGSTPLQIIQQMFPEVDTSNFLRLSDRAHLAILGDLLERAPLRHKLPTYNTLEDAVELFRTRKNILVLTGAGVSVSCGIPDFRSKDGIYARLRSEFPDLPDPTAMFDIRYFRQNPAPFYNFAREIFPGQFVPSVSHRFIKELESAGRLLRNYTQNIDTLEHQTGIKRVVECHGSFSKCTCTQCGYKYEGDEIREEVLDQRIAYCRHCQGVIKPNIVFFGEDLAQDFHRRMAEDKHKIDLIVVIGSSLKVRPVAMIPHCVGKEIPQILINRESLSHYHPDIELLGNCDDILRDISFRLGGSFAEMVASYDLLIKGSASQSKRTLITQEEFLNLALKRKNDTSETTGGEDKEKQSEEPQTKRPRLQETEKKEEHSRKNFEQIQNHKAEEDDENSQDSDDLLKDINEPRLVNINHLLEENKCVAISTHQTIFPGAEYLFDLENLKLVRDVHHNQDCDSSSSSSSSSVSEPDSHANPLSRSTSVDDVVNYQNRKSQQAEMLTRSDSCETYFEYEVSEVIDSEAFTHLCKQMCI